MLYVVIWLKGSEETILRRIYSPDSADRKRYRPGEVSPFHVDCRSEGVVSDAGFQISIGFLAEAPVGILYFLIRRKCCRRISRDAILSSLAAGENFCIECSIFIQSPRSHCLGLLLPALSPHLSSIH